MNSQGLTEKLRSIPPKPGCYLYKDGGGHVIYVGKAVNLRNRVRSYFQKSANLTIKLRRLVDSVCDLEVIVVANELEALVLECNLIKKHQPHYNVRLRDDKNYPYLCVTTSEPFPRLLLTRRARHDGNKYFGPYSGSRAVYSTMDLMKRLFPIVSCGKAFDGRPVQKPCLYYHLGQCLAPCAGLANNAEYRAAVDDIIAFLEGQPERVVRDLRRQMERSAELLQFERAAKLRDQILAVEEVMSRQKVISSQMLDQDVIAIVGVDGPMTLNNNGTATEGAQSAIVSTTRGAQSGACVQMFYIRGGKLIGQNSFLLEGADEDASKSEAVQEFVKQYYQDAAYVPKEILLPCEIDEANIVQTWLRQKRGSKVEFTVPVRGDKRRLMEMAKENAGHALEQIRAEMRAKLGNKERALDELAEELGLESQPKRIECYDISNFQGDHFVGSMVVCTDGEMDKAEYRRFKIKFHENKPDDFAMIREVVSRRLAEGKAGNPKFSRMPDLIIVDGGKGQLASAVEAIRGAGYRVQGQDAVEDDGQHADDGRWTMDDRLPGNTESRLRLGMETSYLQAQGISNDASLTRNETSSIVHRPSSRIPVCGLAKRFEHLFVPGEPDPVILPRTSQALYLVQRIRDEAHRFANAYRVTLQAKKQTASALDLIPGIGPTRRKALIKHFGSIDRMRTASLEELTAAPKMNRRTAEEVYSYFNAAA